MTRRDLLRLLLASPLAATFDVERALWVPKPIVTVPALPWAGDHRIDGALMVNGQEVSTPAAVHPGDVVSVRIGACTPAVSGSIRLEQLTTPTDGRRFCVTLHV